MIPFLANIFRGIKLEHWSEMGKIFSLLYRKASSRYVNMEKVKRA